MLKNKITELFNIDYPIVQAPMAGGVTTTKLVAEVSNCGGLGTMGAGYMTPEQTREQIREIKQLTSHFFGINLFVPNEFTVSQDEIILADQILQPIRKQLDIPPSNGVEIPKYKNVLETFNQQIKIVIEEKVPVCSFTFGIPSREVIDVLKKMTSSQ
jgi:nitronate monooxygenase